LKSSKKWLPKGKNAILIAAYVENIRLIDNIIF
jgi:pantothenate synthetase